jgi:flavin reductase (DIM6/NTAB) family NADH-FMN oxidoreductase RutF/DNA-binding IclR family transcriptional regulator
VSTAPDQVIDPALFRQVLGQYPTGVCVITAVQGDGRPAGMVVGSFTSVSLNPPLVAFFPDRDSSSWAKLSESKHFCVNILSAEQEDVCRKLASKDPDKFSGIAHCATPTGSPIIEGVVAWIDCSLHSVQEAGDHYIVLGSVDQLEIARGGLPLLFFQGGYGRFAPSSLVASDIHGLLTDQLRMVDRARGEMELLAAEICSRCTASARVGDDLVITASAGQSRRDGPATLVGQRLPFVPPTGAVFAAWLPAEYIERWIGERGDPARRDDYRAALTAVRRRGYSVGLLNEAQRAFAAKLDALAEGSAEVVPADLEELIRGLAYDPADLSPEVSAAVRLISAPVFDASGQVALALTLHDFPRPPVNTGIEDYAARLVAAAGRVTKKLGGRLPD